MSKSDGSRILLWVSLTVSYVYCNLLLTLCFWLVPSAPQCLRVLSKSTSQIKIIWEPPATSNGVLRGYQIVARGAVMLRKFQTHIHWVNPSERVTVISNIACMCLQYLRSCPWILFAWGRVNQAFTSFFLKEIHHCYLYQGFESEWRFLFSVGKTSSLEVHENYFILSSVPPDTECTFQVSLNCLVWLIKQ